MTRILALVSVLLGCASAGTSKEPGIVLIPTKYVNGTFYAQPVTERGDKLTFYTDTGGGLWIKKKAVEKDKLAFHVDGDQTILSPWPKFKPGESIPEPLGGPVNVMPEDSDAPAWTRDWDGMLGQQWFSGRVWTFDYPKKQLWFREDKSVPKVEAAHIGAPWLQVRRIG